ncbi:MAG: hypothetical protein PHY26_02665 [Bacilli bacterium]|nr:hypothetical protein [Bacilli bacterium]
MKINFNLYGKEKDLILRVTNLVLFLWLIGSITIFYINMVDYFYQKSKMSYEEYEIINCYYIEEDKGYQDNCETQYQNYLIMNRDNKYNHQKTILTSFGSVIIVSTALYFLNKKKGESK